MVFAGSFLFGGKESPRLESNPHLIAHVAIQNHVCFSLQNDVQCTFDSGQLRRINHQRPGFNEHHLKHQRLHPLAAAEAYHLHPTVDGRIPKGIPSLLTRIPKQDRHIQTRSTAPLERRLQYYNSSSADIHDSRTAVEAENLLEQRLQRYNPPPTKRQRHQ